MLCNVTLAFMEPLPMLKNFSHSQMLYWRGGFLPFRELQSETLLSFCWLQENLEKL